jgi:hypothetical protein
MNDPSDLLGDDRPIRGGDAIAKLCGYPSRRAAYRAIAAGRIPVYYDGDVPTTTPRMVKEMQQQLRAAVERVSA